MARVLQGLVLSSYLRPAESHSELTRCNTVIPAADNAAPHLSTSHTAYYTPNSSRTYVNIECIAKLNVYHNQTRPHIPCPLNPDLHSPHQFSSCSLTSRPHHFEFISDWHLTVTVHDSALFLPATWMNLISLNVWESTSVLLKCQLWTLLTHSLPQIYKIIIISQVYFEEIQKAKLSRSISSECRTN